MTRSPEGIVPPRPRVGTVAMDIEELVAWGERLGRSAAAPLVVTLSGDLGAGKTTLAQAICRGYGVTEDVTSPTFAIAQQYTAPRSSVWHLDLYRLESPAELANVGWEEIVSAHALVLVEWPERAGGWIPADAARITLEHIPGEENRRLLYAGGHA